VLKKDNVRSLVLDINNLEMIDIAGIGTLALLLDNADKVAKNVYLCGIHRNKQLAETLEYVRYSYFG